MKLYIMKQEAIEFFKNNIDLYYTSSKDIQTINTDGKGSH